MAHKYGDLVAQYTETTGTGTYTLTTAVANRRTFGAVLSNGDTTDFKVEGVDNAGNTAWEVATGTYATSGTTLARTTIRSSSTGSAIDWGAGVKTVTMVQASYSMVTTTPTANHIKATGITPANGAIPIGNGSDFTVATLTGTTNRVTVTNSAGGITLTGPQDLHTGASPTFAGATLTGTATAPVFRTAQVTIANDAVYTHAMLSPNTGAVVMVYSINTNFGDWVLNAFVRASGGGNAIVSMYSGSATAVTTSDLTGTTGVSGRMTVAPAPSTSGSIKIENRTGSSRTFNIVVM